MLNTVKNIFKVLGGLAAAAAFFIYGIQAHQAYEELGGRLTKIENAIETQETAVKQLELELPDKTLSKLRADGVLDSQSNGTAKASFSEKWRELESIQERLKNLETQVSERFANSNAKPTVTTDDIAQLRQRLDAVSTVVENIKKINRSLH